MLRFFREYGWGKKWTLIIVTGDSILIKTVLDWGWAYDTRFCHCWPDIFGAACVSLVFTWFSEWVFDIILHCLFIWLNVKAPRFASVVTAIGRWGLSILWYITMRWALRPCSQSSSSPHKYNSTLHLHFTKPTCSFDIGYLSWSRMCLNSQVMESLGPFFLPL